MKLFTSILSRTLLIALVSFSIHLSALAQDDDDVVRVETNLVVLNVTVLDKEGKYVPKLKLADFKVFEDGKEVPAKLISSFGAHETPFASVVLLDSSGSMEARILLALGGDPVS